MRTNSEAGFTRTELIVVCVVVGIVVLVLHGMMWFTHAVSCATSTGMKNRGRSIWLDVVTASSEREPLGLSSVWPKDLGFDASRTSTEYFRLLMSGDAHTNSDGVLQPICEDLHAGHLGGEGVPCAESRETFTSTNNAWQVLCVSTQTPAEVTFLVTRNVDVGRHVNALSSVKFNQDAPYRHDRDRRCVYVTCGGGCYDVRERYLHAPSGFSKLFGSMGTNSTYDVMRP